MAGRLTRLRDAPRQQHGLAGRQDDDLRLAALGRQAAVPVDVVARVLAQPELLTRVGVGSVGALGARYGHAQEDAPLAGGGDDRRRDGGAGARCRSRGGGGWRRSERSVPGPLSLPPPLSPASQNAMGCSVNRPWRPTGTTAPPEAPERP